VPATDAPTRAKGSISSGHTLTGWGSNVDDGTEIVPDLAWPVSVQTYARMRHDPTITSVLAAYIHPIVRARWSIDPRGASDAMVKVCADSLGLPVLGQPADPGPLRRRGVQWRDHIRMAAATVLTYGHAPFNPVYDASTGQAVLASLGERLPQSIQGIDTDDGGDLKSIRQYTFGDHLGTRIDAKDLLWYVREREGAAWQGVSLLRHAFGPWLIKQDLLRVQGTTLNRFGSATPVMEPIPGFHPTDTQIAQAEAIARQVRVGHSAGAALPGWRLRLVGVEGTLPDALPTIHYLDQQIARGALTSVLDLANTGHGNRALGTVFADVLTLALESFAEQLAETATGLCVRLTDFNEGEGANSPAVHVDMSVSRAAIAQTIAAMVATGALTMDDDLQAWLRDAMDLPAPKPTAPDPAPVPAPAPAVTAEAKRRDVAETIQKVYLGVDTVVTSDEAREIVNAAGASLVVPGPDFSKPAPTPPVPGAPTDPAAVPAVPPVPVAARKVAAGDWPYRRALTAAEESAGYDPAALDRAQGTALDALLLAWGGITTAWIAALKDQVTAAAGDPAALAALTVDTTDAADLLAVAMSEAADAGAVAAAAEAAHQGVTAPDPTPDPATISVMAAAVTTVMGASFAAAAAREAVRLVGSAGVAAVDLADRVASFLVDLSGTYAQDVLGGAVADAISAGRAWVFRAIDRVATFHASEIRDSSTCENCAAIDGTTYDSLETALAEYPHGQYRACLGRERCRGTLVAVWGLS
jgi:hypothetical protein